MTLPNAFLDTPIAHRGLHDRAAGVIENSRSAFERAIAAGFAIELDLQLSSDDHAMVFHDYDLGRLTHHKGPVRQRSAKELSGLKLKDGVDAINDLPEILALVRGAVPLLIELKDQDGAMGSNIGTLEAAVAKALSAYDGPVALMSFNPHSVIRLAELLPDVPRGIVTSAYDPKIWPLPKPICARLRDIPDYDAANASFISHEWSDLDRPRVAELKSSGASILCWTVKSKADADTALRIADNITFEDYVPS